jgi:hypothetical protein
MKCPKRTLSDGHERTPAHTQNSELEEGFSDTAQAVEAEAVICLPPRDSNPDMLIQRLLTRDSSAFTQHH